MCSELVMLSACRKRLVENLEEIAQNRCPLLRTASISIAGSLAKLSAKTNPEFGGWPESVLRAVVVQDQMTAWASQRSFGNPNEGAGE
jgi:hypothetical protein